METHLGLKFLPVILIGLLSIFTVSQSQTAQSDAAAMLALKTTLSPPQQLNWSDPDPCNWGRVGCSNDKRVTRIQIGHQNLQGTLPPDLSTLSELERLELHWNNISGPLPSLNGLKSLRVLMLSNNQFSSIPVDFFTGLSSLQSVEIDNNPFTDWEIPESLKSASALQNFSANSANINGSIPDFFGPDNFPGLVNLRLALNKLEGELPGSLSGSQIESFWVNGQTSEAKLGGRIDVIQNMTFLKEVWLQLNAFSGPLPDFSGLKSLESLIIKDNSFTGPVPVSLINLASLKSLNLTNNLLQGPMPKFSDSVAVDMTEDSNSFCLPQPGDCDPRVNSLISVVKAMNYPVKFADNWKGNDPCTGWIGITCSGGNITIISFQKMGLTGFISPDFASLKSLQKLVLADNNLTGSIPVELTTLPALAQLDVANNDISGELPVFKSNVMMVTKGNPNIGKEKSDNSSPSPSALSPGSSDKDMKSKRRVGVLVFSLIGGFFVIFLVGLAAFWLFRSKQKRYSQVQSPIEPAARLRDYEADKASVKITVAGSSASIGSMSEIGDFQMGEAGNTVFSIQMLKAVTNNFSEKNILGQGGFGTVYKGEMSDGTYIAVKRMEDGVVTGKGIAEFNSEIAVLTKVRHRHLVALLGYCLDVQEKLLVYEYMPQGTLSRHLFNWAEEGLKPLEWTRRLTIALDVARGVEYLHGLAHQSFIHRDLKPSNILLGDNMRAKVSDFGLVRPAPEGKGSIQTRIAGTFGYLAPEYAVTGRVTTKVDVYSIGVILMELITGRKAIDDTQPDESMHLVTWFRRMHLNRDTFKKSIDPTIDLDEETLANISIVAELAGHCSAREPHQRPDMGHAVNVLSSLVEHWKPSNQSNAEDMYGCDREMSLPSVLKRWQDLEGTSGLDDSSSYSYLPSLDNTMTSIPSRP